MKNRFYLACFRDNVGGNVGFHAVNGRGYTTNIDNAHNYTLEEAQHEWAMAREYDQPISADHVDSLSCWKVDCQYIPHEHDFSESQNGYVAFQKSKWDGNDVYWYATEGASLNFKLAQKFTLQEAKRLSSQHIIIPFDKADSNKRRTFAMSLLNKRIMVQGAGLRTPDHIKRQRRRSSNSKTRMNCPTCGKIHWQYNPYEFEKCSDFNCKSNRREFFV